MRGALAGTRVVEWSAGRPGAYAGKLLRGLGADVVLLESPGARERAFTPGPVPAAAAQLDARIRFLHGGKQSVLFDPADAASRESALALIGAADILVMDQELRDAEAAGMSPEALHERFPNLVIVAITLAGLQGEARYWRYSDLIAQSIGGIAYATPSRVPDPAQYPPLKPGGYQADYTCGLHAASGALLGLQLRRRTNTGQVIDVSAQAMIASFVRMDMAYRTYAGVDGLNISSMDRTAPNGKFSTVWGLVPCKDGYWAFQASEQYQWAGLMRVMGNPEWAAAPHLQDPLERFLYWDDEIEPRVVAWSMTQTKLDVFHAAQANDVPVFPCLTVEELLVDEQQVARGFFVELPAGDSHNVVKVPGAVVHLEKTPWQPSFEPPAVGQHTAEAAARWGLVAGEVRA
ncbi:MAG: CoA transferase [Dehalococcoidia bacterium]|nr:CoA transferase [Dehalococcoidia bacterium]